MLSVKSLALILKSVTISFRSLLVDQMIHLISLRFADHATGNRNPYLGLRPISGPKGVFLNKSCASLIERMAMELLWWVEG